MVATLTSLLVLAALVMYGLYKRLQRAYAALNIVGNAYNQLQNEHLTLIRMHRFPKIPPDQTVN